MQFSCSLTRIIAFLAVITGATALHALDGLSDAIARLRLPGGSTRELYSSQLATADFDNDGHPDGALLLRNGNRAQVEVSFGSHRVWRATVTSSPLHLDISTKDVNEDGSPDLELEDAFSHQSLFIWLNNGNGHFHAVPTKDYPLGPQGHGPKLTRPLLDKQFGVLEESSRVRCRYTVGYLDRQTPVPSPSQFRRKSVRVIAMADASPNLVRGSPVLLLSDKQSAKSN